MAQAQKAAIKAQRKAMDEMFQAMKRSYSQLNSEQAELESALGSITARSLRSQQPPPAALLSAMRSLPTLGLLTGKFATPGQTFQHSCRACVDLQVDKAFELATGPIKSIHNLW